MGLEVAILGYTAAIMEILMGTPQAWQSFRQRKDDLALTGVSLPSALLMFAHSIMWAIYAILTDEIPVLLAHSLSIPVYFCIVLFVAKSRLRLRRGLAPEASEHLVHLHH